MKVASLSAQVEQCRILTKQERNYWRSNLNSMSPEQLTRLNVILSEAAKIQWSDAVEQYIKIIQAQDGASAES